MAIADRINEMYTHVGDVYDTITNVDLPTNKNIQNIPQTIKDSYLEIMNNGIDTIWNNWEKVTGEGTSLTLNNTEQAPMKNELKGNTYQTQYSGKNLLPPTIATETKNGITLTNNGDGSYTLTGTYSSTTEFSIDLPTTLNGTYSFSGNNPASSKNIQFRILKSSGSPWSTYLNTVNSISENQTIENGTEQGIRIVGSFTSGFTLKPQLESGSTATSYEPYVGGVAIPNPNSPQDVNVVSGDNEILVNGKNLFDIGIDLTSWLQTNNNGLTINNYTIGRTTATITGNKLVIDSYNNSGYTWISKWVQLEKNTDYVISGTTNGTLRLVGINSKDVNSVGTLIKEKTSTTTQTFNSGNYNYYMISFYPSAQNQYFENIMIEKGSSASTYEPYQGNSYSINLPVENLVDTPSTNSAIVGSGLTYSRSEDGTISVSGTSNRAYDYNLTTSYTFKAGETYTFFCERGGTINVNYYISFNSTNGGQLTFAYSNPAPITRTIVEDQTLPIKWSLGNNTQVDYSVRFMIQKGSKANSYTPYGTTPIELCKIGNYQDYFYKDSDKWYKYGAIGKVVLNGSENWSTPSTNRFNVDGAIPNGNFITGTIPTYLCDKYKGFNKTGTNGEFNTLVANENYGFNFTNNSANNTIRFKDTRYTSLDDFKNWLSLNNVPVYYILYTPTNTEITYQPLIDQLNELEKAISYENQTNISQINNDLPFIISASALKKGDTIENNSASLLMSFGGLPNTNGEEETPDFEEDVSDVEEETPIEESIEEEIDEEPVEEETEIEEEGE